MSDDPNPRVVSVPVALLEEIAEHVNLTLPVRYGPILDVLIAAAPQKQQHETHTWSCVTQPKECPGISAQEQPRRFVDNCREYGQVVPAQEQPRRFTAAERSAIELPPPDRW